MSTTSGLARTPELPYYAVIFTSQRTEGDRGYGGMAQKMEALGARYMTAFLASKVCAAPTAWVSR